MTYAFIAYTVIWLGVLLYVVALSRENSRLKAQIEALEAAQSAAAARRDAAGGGGDAQGSGKRPGSQQAGSRRVGSVE